MAFKVGDTVKLKSGGPLMTVAILQTDGNIYCMWFATADAAKPTYFAFVPETLDPVR